MTQTPYLLKGMEYDNCNCAYGCPCQFNALPTYGDCQYLLFSQVDEGYYGDTKLDGLKFVIFGKFPGAVHEGNGTLQLVIDEVASNSQREAIRRIVFDEDTEEMKTHWAIYHALSSQVYDPIFAPIELEADIETRTARARVPGLIDSQAGPIKNPVTGEDHRAQIVLPEGFEFTVAEMGSGSSTTQDPIPMQFTESYAHFNVLHTNQDGVVR
jgi:hypothetical protein